MREVGSRYIQDNFILGDRRRAFSVTAADGQSFDRSVRHAENFEPSIPYAEQHQAAEAKLAALKQKHGKRLNIVWILVDDMGMATQAATAVAQ
ncbi:hypothetical protein [Adhaeretor mobilis]|uniref:Uncharacterized protein n=1 Tax=Adhaeretor mobilis TaxID=1930276 RepID=A0A517N0M7_9BACT|nr:hypothetical protein [Adhaeretor mobilis]QDT00686.1 hypothetical protein HG15A2_40250 [Adhaeretor mobilis]